MTDPRLEHHRGPCRGDGIARRSLVWLEQRRVALTRPCPYVLVIPAPRGVSGARGQRLACAADVDELCRDPRTGEPLAKLAAHTIRIFPRVAQEVTPL